jgi:hypothetical protein
MPKKYEKPDRVYGLMQTENFKILLDSADKRVPLDEDIRILRHTLEVSPFKRDREPLLFPFIIIEAKSDTVGDTAAVEMQTAFCIRRLLMLQDGLRAATGEESLWQTGPLLWFFAWHGNEWEIKGSFIDSSSTSTPRYVSDAQCSAFQYIYCIMKISDEHSVLLIYGVEIFATKVTHYSFC